MNLLYLSHISCLRVENDIPVLESNGYKVTLLNTHKVHFKTALSGYTEFTDIINLYEPGSLLINKLKRALGNMIKRIFAVVKLDSLPITVFLREKWDVYSYSSIRNKHRNIIYRALRDRKIEVVYAAWSTTVFPEIKAIKDLKMNIPVVLSIQSYPIRESRVIGYSRDEDESTREIMENLEGRIHCSRAMYEYMNNHFDLQSYGKDVISMGYYSEKYAFSKKERLISDNDNEPHIVFIGDVNFSQRTFNDIRSQIRELSDEKIHVHFAYTKDKIGGVRKYIHMYERKELVGGQLANFMTQFDACIVLYNIDKKYVRYEISLPERFLFALNSGIPIVVPKGYYAACEEIINKYGIGYSYEGVKDLKARLMDRDSMSKYRDNATKTVKDVSFERNFKEIDKFIKSVCPKS